VAIGQRIDAWQDGADMNVTRHAGEYVQDTLPTARTTSLPGEGHL
jgi:hypothetical protein